MNDDKGINVRSVASRESAQGVPESVLTDLEKLLANGTPRPWRQEETLPGMPSLGANVVRFGPGPGDICQPGTTENAAMVVACVNTAPALIARIRELEAGLREASDTALAYFLCLDTADPSEGADKEIDRIRTLRALAGEGAK